MCVGGVSLRSGIPDDDPAGWGRSGRGWKPASQIISISISRSPAPARPLAPHAAGKAASRPSWWSRRTVVGARCEARPHGDDRGQTARSSVLALVLAISGNGLKTSLRLVRDRLPSFLY